MTSVKGALVFDFDLTLTMQHTGGFPKSLDEVTDRNETFKGLALWKEYLYPLYGGEKNYERLITVFKQAIAEGYLLFINSRGMKQSLMHHFNDTFPGMFKEIYAADRGQLKIDEPYDPTIKYIQYDADKDKGTDRWGTIKSVHLQEISRKYKIPPSSIYFFDDTEVNIKFAKAYKFPNSFLITGKTVETCQLVENLLNWCPPIDVYLALSYSPIIKTVDGTMVNPKIDEYVTAHLVGKFELPLQGVITQIPMLYNVQTKGWEPFIGFNPQNGRPIFPDWSVDYGNLKFNLNFKDIISPLKANQKIGVDLIEKYHQAANIPFASVVQKIGTSSVLTREIDSVISAYLKSFGSGNKKEDAMILLMQSLGVAEGTVGGIMQNANQILSMLNGTCSTLASPSVVPKFEETLKTVRIKPRKNCASDQYNPFLTECLTWYSEDLAPDRNTECASLAGSKYATLQGTCQGKMR
jgi:hypothetical protein